MPVRNKQTEKWVRDGELVVLAIAQEHHRNRSRLFAQWQELNWPILHDPINLMQVRGVPIEVAIDEHGIVRSLRPDMKTFQADFLDKTFASAELEAPQKALNEKQPDIDKLRRDAEHSSSSQAWRELGDAIVLWGDAAAIDKAINAYQKAIDIDPRDGDAHFRLGVCYRLRYESQERKENDFQKAVDYWHKARQIQPNQYIWRRRIEQYGPRLTKPYPFYDWVQTALQEVKDRGEKPVIPAVSLSDSEVARPARSFDAEGSRLESPDPQGRILRDIRKLVNTEVTVVPPVVKSGGAARVYVTLRPDAKHKAHWSDEAPPLKLWIDTPDGWQVQPQLVMSPQHISQSHQLEFEISVPADSKGTLELTAYALYYVCEELDGVCHFLRQDIPLKITVD